MKLAISATIVALLCLCVVQAKSASADARLGVHTVTDQQTPISFHPVLADSSIDKVVDAVNQATQNPAVQGPGIVIPWWSQILGIIGAITGVYGAIRHHVPSKSG